MKIKNIYYIGVALLMAGCSNEAELTKTSDTLSGGEKTPLTIAATLGTGNAVTRAAGNTFEENDQLLAYIRHITNTNEAVASYTPVAADKAPMLVTFTKGDEAMESTTDANVKQTSDLTASTTLYWDDFSASNETTTDLRTENHGLQSYYGYCYNGKTGVTLTEATAGTLTWTIAADQSASADVVKKEDLLWSPAQQAITYQHANSRLDNDNTTKDHGVLTIPYYHAMSEVTVTLTAAEGFTGSPLTNTQLTLNAMNTSVDLNAPDTTYSNSTTSASVKMFAESYSEGLTRNYTAIVAPGTKLKVGEKLLDIKGVDGNDYTLTITANMLAIPGAWGKGHEVKNDDGKYILTRHGVNYHLTVTVNKTKIESKATLADWKTVNATGTGDIVFPEDDGDDLVMNDTLIEQAYNNVSVVAVDKNKFANEATFSLFTLKSTTDNTEATARTNNAYEYATIPKFKDNADDANDEWVNDPVIYWPNKTDNYYFRALAKFNSATNGVNSITSVGTYSSNKGTDVSQGTIADGHDILWGTSAGHKGSTSNRIYQRGQAIPPRTGDVPMAFDHAMSKITINLATPKTGTTDANANVNLTYSKVTISNIYSAGTIKIENGEIDHGTAAPAGTIAGAGTTSTSPTAATPLSEYIVIPQTITDNAKLTITLYTDNTYATAVATYNLQLNTCVQTGTTTTIPAWQRGKHYTYTIYVEKEKITFRALIKDWETSEGSGNANLEWD